MSDAYAQAMGAIFSVIEAYMSAVGNRINQAVNPFLSISRFMLLKFSSRGLHMIAANLVCILLMRPA